MNWVVVILIVAILAIIAACIFAYIHSGNKMYNYKCSFCDWELKNSKVRITDPFCPKCGRNGDGKTKEQLTAWQGSAADEIIKFKRLLDDGVITQKEFEDKKKKLL
jgi:hypothetical protein